MAGPRLIPMKEKSPVTLDCELTSGWRLSLKWWRYQEDQFMLYLGIDQHGKQLTVNLRDEFGCADVVLVQPASRSRKKTDRRDAAKLSELSWINRQRFSPPNSTDRYFRLCSVIQSATIWRAAGDMVSSICGYSSSVPFLQFWKR